MLISCCIAVTTCWTEKIVYSCLAVRGEGGPSHQGCGCKEGCGGGRAASHKVVSARLQRRQTITA